MGLSEAQKSDLIEAMLPDLLSRTSERGSIESAAEHLEAELSQLSDEDLVRVAQWYCPEIFKDFFKRSTTR